MISDASSNADPTESSSPSNVERTRRAVDSVTAPIQTAARDLEREVSRTFSREVKELRRANEILKLASAFFAQAELDRRLKF